MVVKSPPTEYSEFPVIVFPEFPPTEYSEFPVIFEDRFFSPVTVMFPLVVFSKSPPIELVRLAPDVKDIFPVEDVDISLPLVRVILLGESTDISPSVDLIEIFSGDITNSPLPVFILALDESMR